MGVARHRSRACFESPTLTRRPGALQAWRSTHAAKKRSTRHQTRLVRGVSAAQPEQSNIRGVFAARATPPGAEPRGRQGCPGGDVADRGCRGLADGKRVCARAATDR
ncbi:hypothetical protein PsYK624_141550 [Phanerochaete sordida]|uniref:Uncharacterized protein n=1 Tax=Phanerochaete sordida TaxID=48140 RepID=A0A9P3LJZ0_9APHY|nr:hypothetical protein PsYK624_141550 [Phanerochaete sordida]